jgi:cell wall assembly regulator SMI1
MTDAIRRELERAKEILAQHGFALEFGAGVSRDELARAERVTGLSFDNALGELYSLANGSFGKTCFAVQTDEVTPCCLATLEDSLAWWADWLPRATVDGSRDPRLIGPEKYVSPNWFPFAEFNSWGTTAYFDLNVGLEDTPEQVIAFQHDPDAFYWIADGLAAFLSRSNGLLEQHARDILFVDGRPSVFSPKRL